MRNQNTTKRTSKSLKAQQLKELAFHLSAIMQNPQMPADLYNAIGDVITDRSNAIPTDTESYILLALTTSEAQIEELYSAPASDSVIQLQQIS